MRILIIAPEQIPVPPVKDGSVEICIWAAAQRLAERHDVVVVSRAYPGYAEHTTYGRLTVIRTGAAKRPSSSYIYHVLQIASKLEFDLIQIDNRPAYVRAARRMFPDARIVLFLHSLTFITPPKITHSRAKAYLQEADAVIANSDSLKHELLIRFPSLLDRIHKVWLGVDIDRFQPADAARKLAARQGFRMGNRFTILFAGRVIPRKGLPVLMRAMRYAKKRTGLPVQLLIAGGARKRSYMKRMQWLAKKLGVRARFLNTVPHAKMHRVYQASDCFVCPSQQHEAFGLVNVEAMASGLPVVASRIGGIKEIIQHGHNGYLIKSYRSSVAFGRVLAKLLVNNELAAEAGREGRVTAEAQFSWERTVDQLEIVYHHVLLSLSSVKDDIDSTCL